MKDFSKLVEDYSRTPVPAEKTVNALHLAVMVIGVMITVPAFVLGSRLGEMLGFNRAMAGILLGAFMLTLISAATGSVGVKTHLSTSMINRYTFGEKGAVLINTMLGVTALGWYSVIISLFGEAAIGALNDLNIHVSSVAAATIFGSILTILITMFGFKALDKMALAAVPVMLLFLIAIVHLALREVPLQEVFQSKAAGEQLSIGGVASLIVGSFIVGATLFPDLCRYARNVTHVWISSVLSYGVGYIFVLALAMAPSIATGKGDLITIIGAVGLGAAGFAMLLFSTLTTVAYNLYSGSLAAAAIMKKTAKWKLVVALGVLSTVVAVSGASQYFIGWITVLSLCIPPIGGVYVVDWLVLRRLQSDGEVDRGILWSPMAACLVGSLVAYLTHAGTIQLTAVPALDAMLSAALTFYVASVIKLHWRGDVIMRLLRRNV